MRAIVLKEIPDDPVVRLAWNGLVSQLERPEVFFTYEWALAASRAFRESIRPLLVLMYDSGQLSGVAALATDPDTPRSAFFLGSTTADYCDVVSAPQNKREILVALLEELKKLNIRDLVLANVQSDTSTFHNLPHAAKVCGFHFTSRAAHDCGVIEFGDNQQRETLLRSVRQKDREKRGLNKLKALGTVGIVHAVTPEAGRTSLEFVISSQIARFFASGRVSPLIYPQRRAFLLELTDLLGQAGWLKISRLELNGKPIAANYGFYFEGSWFWYLPTFDVERKNASPGSCLLRMLVEEGVEDLSLRRLDLGLGDESYKERFQNNLQPTRYIQLAPGLARHLANVGGSAITRAAARLPRVKKIADHFRALVRKFVLRVRESGFAATISYVFRKTSRAVSSKDELAFFEAGSVEFTARTKLELLPLTWQHLAQAATVNFDDAQTLDYVMRSAARLERAADSGFVLRTDGGQLVHFLWVAGYDGFYLAENGETLKSSGSNQALIFDCWTPATQRGHSYYTDAIRLAAHKLKQEGRQAWIFAAANNASSVRGILKAGFLQRFSLTRVKKMGHSTVIRRDSREPILP